VARRPRSNPPPLPEPPDDADRTVTPRLRFPEFRATPWTLTPLSRLASPVDDRVGTMDCIPYTVTSGVGLISQEEKFGRTIAGNSFKNYIRLLQNDFAYNKSATKAFPEGYVSRYAGDEPAAVPNSIFTCFRSDPRQIDPVFLEYQFAGNLHGRWLRKYLTVGARAHGSLNVSDDDLFALPVPLPLGPLAKAEQQKIAACLGSLDDLIAAQGRKVEALKAHKKGLMQHLFPREGETRPQVRFPDLENQSEWKRHPFGEVARFINGRAYSKEELLDQGPYRVLRVGNFFTNDHWYYSNLQLDDDKYCEDGDLLYAWSASFGPRIWTGEKVIYHYHIWKVVEHDGFDRRFLYACLDYETEKMRTASARGLGMQHLTKSGIEAWECAMPSDLDEQRRIADCLGSLDATIAAESAALAALRTHKAGLMQQLFPAVPSPNGSV
jgi:type I restriction enzyme S subunit